jgi:hypothetical protein
MRRVLLVLIALHTFCSLTFAQNELVFRRNGAGLWIEAGQKSELVVVMEMRRQRDDQLTLTVRPINGIPRRFTGRVSARDDSSYTVTITSSAKSNASGIIYVANDTAQSLRFVIGYAETDGRKVAFHFTKERPLRWNALAFGTGVLAEGDERTDIRLASVVATQDSQSEVLLLLHNGSVRSYSANGSLKAESELSITGTGPGGSMKIKRNRAKHGIEMIEGRATVDGVPVSFSFASDR